ncbi:MAG: PQQ-binding-like beta-propeller repeat protein [Planctomycetota bacterium]|nr:PQQ-binding-like beta-propeller repeat protein [Planctomycetota bacterium]
MRPTLLIFFIARLSLFASDWPTFRGDSGRGGYSPDALPMEMSLLWVSKARHVPQPAWPGADARMPFDQAFQPIVAGGMLYFASSADCKLYALDAATGKEQWTYFADGPVRFAPLAWKDRIYFVSDDSYLYCLTAKDGSFLWKVRGGPSDSLLLGNDRMISRWPARGGPVLVDDTLYFSAGIWPSEGIFLHAVDPSSGRFLWTNDTAGWMYIGQPHGGADALSGVSIQGDLAVAGDVLLAPNGRAVPAGFRRSDGQFMYFHLQKNTHRGGAEIVAADSVFFNAGGIFRTDDGLYLGKSAPPSLIAVTPERIFSIEARAGKEGAGNYLLSIERQKVWKETVATDRKGKQVATKVLNVPDIGPKLPHPATSLIIAGNSLVLGNPGKVSVVDPTTGEIRFSTAIEGKPLAMAVADSRLYISNDLGTIYCFGAGDGETKIHEPLATTALADDDNIFVKAADEIIRRGNVTEGYCLDFECGEGDLALELARKTRLQIYAVDSDPESVKKARKKLDDAGLYGNRVTIVLSRKGYTPFPNYFADLVVSGRSIAGKTEPIRSEEMGRMLRPYGGLALMGPPEKMTKEMRGPLPGAGEWTHQYSGPGNTTCSNDSIVRGPLGLLWFSDLQLAMPSRHGRAPAPLFFNGRMFIEGMDALKCVDAYNGRFLWEISLPNILKPLDQDHLMGTAGTGSNICVSEEGLFIATQGKCLKIDQKTGKVLAEYHAPGARNGDEVTWGIIACTGGILFGTTANTEHLVQWRYRKSDMNGMFTESNALFAMDATTGNLKWRYQAKHSLRHNAIAFDGERVYLIDQPLAKGDLWDQVKTEERRGKPQPIQPQADKPEAKSVDAFEEGLKDDAEKDESLLPAPPIPVLLALDGSTGKTVWSNLEKVEGTVLQLSNKHDVLLVSYQKTRFQLKSELGSQMFACRASTGEKLWTLDSRKIRSRPMINDRTIYAEPGAWDLLTGEEQEFEFARSYGCGIAASSKHLMVFRSATLGYTDLSGDFGTENYGGLRPGCWINAIPAGGLVLVPDYTARCRCSYPIQASIALQPRGARPPMFTPHGKISPEPFAVRLAAGSQGQPVHYTLDGSVPTRNSPQWTGQLKIDETTTLKARGYSDGQPTAVSEVTYIVDPDMIPLEGPEWKNHDAGDGKQKSDWQMKGTYLTELSNLYVGSATDPSPAMERPGSLRIYSSETSSNGEMSLQIASSDDDVLGVAFRVQAEDRYYLWAMDLQRGFHVLAIKDGQTYKVLASNKERYEKNKWYDLKVSMNGPDIKIYLDDQLDLEATDSTLSSGKIGLYSWGCAGSKFRRLRWKDSKQKP